MLLELQQSWCCNSFPWGPRPVLSVGHTPIVYALYVLQCPAVHPVLQVRLQQCRTERDNDLHSTRTPKPLVARLCPIPQSVCMSRVDPPQVQNLALVLVIRHVVGGCLDLYLVLISLLVLSTLSGGNSFIQVSIVSRLAQNILWSYMQVIDENFKEKCP